MINKIKQPGAIKLIFLLILFIGCNACNSQDKNTVTVDEFEKLIINTTDKQLIDVRTPEEFNNGHLKDALNIDFKNENFKAEIGKLDKNKPVLVYCLSGVRSAAAAAEMRKSGFISVMEMKGGISKWKEFKKPVVGETESNR